jgi:uncharacterized protein YegJ (DUF2314 family)
MASMQFASGDDPELQQAMARARETFRFFWRELAWERRRIVPALDLAAIKAPFSDPPGRAGARAGAEVEQMWVGDVDFDGRTVSGRLLNSPRWVRSVREGDRVEVPLATLSDWMYALEGQVYGAHTVNLLRARMPPAEREAHDGAWGLDFGDPRHVRLLPPEYPPPPAEHPMALNMGASLAEHLKADPGAVTARSKGGLTLLHELALAGSAQGVATVLAHGADPSAPAGNGMTPLQLARALGWEEAAAVLVTDGAR